MNTNRLIVVLLSVIVIMQGAILYKQHRAPRPSTPEVVRDAPAGSTVSLVGMPVRGDKEAKVVLVEFSDYECPYCMRHAGGVGKELDTIYVSTGKLRHAFANHPLPIHQNAIPLAIGAICAGQQGRYWEMHDWLFLARPKARDQVLNAVESVPLDTDAFQLCFSNPATPPEVERDLKMAEKLGLSGTPGFALGRVDPTGQTVRIERLILGAVPLDIFKTEIDGLIVKS